MERSRLSESGTVLETDSLPPSWAAKISSSVRTAAASSVRVIDSMDTSLSPVAGRWHTGIRAQKGKQASRCRSGDGWTGDESLRLRTGGRRVPAMLKEQGAGKWTIAQGGAFMTLFGDKGHGKGRFRAAL